VILWQVGVVRICNVIHSVIWRLDIIRWDTMEIFGRWSSCSSECGRVHPHRVLARYTKHQHRSHATRVPRQSPTVCRLLRLPELRGLDIPNGFPPLVPVDGIWGALCRLSEDAAGFSEGSLFVILYRFSLERDLDWAAGREQHFRGGMMQSMWVPEELAPYFTRQRNGKHWNRMKSTLSSGI
jgi:hypothetical protein